MSKKESLTDLGWRTILTKGWWSLLYIGIFVFGKYIPLPFANLTTKGGNIMLAATGGDSSRASLFSLGIGPWMSSMIIVGMLGQLHLPGLSKLTEKKLDWIQKGLTFFLAVIQAFVVLHEFSFTSTAPFARFVSFLVLLAGSFLLVWLSVENDKNGLGGITLILMANMFFALMRFFIQGIIPGLRPQAANWTRGIALLAMLALGTVTVLLTNAERRIPVTKLLISSEFGSESYLPIRVLPAGTMPAMFAMTIFALPRYLLLFLRNVTGARIWQILADCFQINVLPGFFIYNLILVALTYGFAYISIDPLEISEKMQKSGDYIPGFHPGKETEKYLHHVINVFSFVSSVYFVVIVGLPMGLNLVSPNLGALAMIPNYVIILAGFSATIVEEIDVLRIRSHYVSLI